MNRTPWNPEWSDAIARVTRLVETLFSCRVRFQTIETFLEDARATGHFAAQDLVFLESTMFAPPPMVRGVCDVAPAGCFAFPLRVRRANIFATPASPSGQITLVGMATIEGLAASDDERLQQIGEFLQLAVEARLDAFERLLDIEQQEAMQKVLLENRENGNVVPLFPVVPFQRFTEVRDDVPTMTLADLGPEAEAKLPLEQPVLFIAHDSEDTVALERVALDLFNKTDLWFFVRMEDLHPETFASAKALRDLGRLCIYVSDLSKVSIERQLRLAEAFGPGSDVEEGPRLLASSYEPPSVLISKGLLLPHLLDLFMEIEIAPTDTVSTATRVERMVGMVERHMRGEMVEDSRPPATLIPMRGHFRNPEVQPGSSGEEPPPTFH